MFNQLNFLISSFNLFAPKANTGLNLSDYLRVQDKQGNSSSIAEVYNSPSVFVNLIVSNLFLIAGLIIFFMIVGAGFSYLKDSDKGKDDAKNLATGAVLGFLVMFAAYWIVQIVKLLTGADIPIDGPGPI